MNMHGIIFAQEESGSRVRLGAPKRVRDWIRRRRMFMLAVVLPTLLVAVYYYGIASSQYESEAHFIVKSTNQAVPALGISQALSAVTGLSAAQSEAQSVADYLTSHDVVATLQRDLNLVGRFQRPGTDPISRLYGDPPTPERLLAYYQDQVSVVFNTETGITTLKVRSFSPTDSLVIIQRLLALGEARVNMLNVRGYRDTLSQAQAQLSETEDALAVVQSRLTHFRQDRRDVDPQASGQAQIGLVSRMSGDLSAARAQLDAMGRTIDRSSPQYLALAARVRALESQLGSQSSRLTGGETAIARDIGGYEDLRMRQQFLAKRYDAASANLDRAREQAQRQQLYVIRVVEPNMPVKSTYPKRWRVVLLTVIGLLLAYGIGWLIAAGVKEHAN